MKKILIVLALVALISTPAFAMLDDNSTLKDSNNQLQGQIAEGGDAIQGQGQGQQQGQAQGQGQGQAQGQAAIAAQGQIQGNLGIQRGNDVANSVKVEGDNVKTYAVSYPALSGGEGVSQANAYSLFGGLGLSNTEKYKAIITQIQAIEASSLDAELKDELVKDLVMDMVDSNKKQRFLGLFWETSGRNLLNLFGILSWDSFWKDGQHPFTKGE